MKYIALLRGINVSGQKIIKMADLKMLFEALAFKQVQTYIQSGNVVFESDETDISSLIEKIESKISSAYQFEVPVQVFTIEVLKEVHRQNPFIGNSDADISHLHLTFLEHEPDTGSWESIESIDNGNDELKRMGSFVYIYCPNGYGKTKLNNNVFERKLKMKATTRNWKTIEKLVELASI